MTQWLLNDLLADWPMDMEIPEVQVSGVTLDSRLLEPGNLFIALEGKTDHGLKYITAAQDKACSAILYDPEQKGSQRYLREIQKPLLPIPGLASRSNGTPTR